MIWMLVAIGVAVMVAASGFCSATEIALYRASRVRLRAEAEAGDRRAAAVLRSLGNLTALVTTMIVGSNIANYIGTFLLTWRLESAGSGWAEVWAAVILTPVFFVFAEMLPKQLAIAQPDRWAMRVAWWTAALRWVLWPMTAVLGVMPWIVGRLRGNSEEPTGRARVLEHLDVGVAENVLSPEQNRMARRVMELESLTLRDVMTPIGECLLVGAEESCGTVARKLLDSGAASAVVLDAAGKPSGKLVTVNRLLQSSAPTSAPVGGYGRDIPRLDGRMSLPAALRHIRPSRMRWAVVTGRGGGVIGVMSLRGLLERIVDIE